MKIFLYVLLVLVIGGLGALFWNWALDLFIDWPITWGNWAKTWLGLVLIVTLLKAAK